MEKITLNDLIDIVEYKKVRDEFRRDIMTHKRARRIELGPEISLTFEDRQTVMFQIQEMMRAEQMIHDDVIQAEIDVYNTLLPDEGQLSATLFIEITEEKQIKEKLHKFLGLTDGHSLWLQVEDQKIYAQFEAGRSKEDKISSVHYIRFAISPAVQDALENPATGARFCIAQGDYQHETPMTADTRASLLGDLQSA